MVSWMLEGLPLSTITRWPSSTASSIEWVTKTIAVGRSLPDAQQLELQDLARLRIDRRERLVHQQHVRLDGERARQPAALLHAAGHLIGERGLEAAEADQLDELRHLALDLRLAARRPCAGHRRRCRTPSSTGTGRNAGTPWRRRRSALRCARCRPRSRRHRAATGRRCSATAWSCRSRTVRRWRRSRVRPRRNRCCGTLRACRSAWPVP